MHRNQSFYLSQEWPVGLAHLQVASVLRKTVPFLKPMGIGVFFIWRFRILGKQVLE